MLEHMHLQIRAVAVQLVTHRTPERIRIHMLGNVFHQPDALVEPSPAAYHHRFRILMYRSEVLLKIDELVEKLSAVRTAQVAVLVYVSILFLNLFYGFVINLYDRFGFLAALLFSRFAGPCLR